MFKEIKELGFSCDVFKGESLGFSEALIIKNLLEHSFSTLVSFEVGGILYQNIDDKSILEVFKEKTYSEITLIDIGRLIERMVAIGILVESEVYVSGYRFPITVYGLDIESLEEIYNF